MPSRKTTREDMPSQDFASRAHLDIFAKKRSRYPDDSCPVFQINDLTDKTHTKVLNSTLFDFRMKYWPYNRDRFNLYEYIVSFKDLTTKNNWLPGQDSPSADENEMNQDGDLSADVRKEVAPDTDDDEILGRRVKSSKVVEHFLKLTGPDGKKRVDWDEGADFESNTDMDDPYEFAYMHIYYRFVYCNANPATRFVDETMLGPLDRPGIGRLGMFLTPNDTWISKNHEIDEEGNRKEPLRKGASKEEKEEEKMRKKLKQWMIDPWHCWAALLLKTPGKTGFSLFVYDSEHYQLFLGNGETPEPFRIAAARNGRRLLCTGAKLLINYLRLRKFQINEVFAGCEATFDTGNCVQRSFVFVEELLRKELPDDFSDQAIYDQVINHRFMSQDIVALHPEMVGGGWIRVNENGLTPEEKKIKASNRKVRDAEKAEALKTRERVTRQVPSGTPRVSQKGAKAGPSTGQSAGPSRKDMDDALGGPGPAPRRRLQRGINPDRRDDDNEPAPAAPAAPAAPRQVVRRQERRQVITISSDDSDNEHATYPSPHAPKKIDKGKGKAVVKHEESEMDIDDSDIESVAVSRKRKDPQFTPTKPRDAPKRPEPEVDDADSESEDPASESENKGSSSADDDNDDADDEDGAGRGRGSGAGRGSGGGGGGRGDGRGDGRGSGGGGGRGSSRGAGRGSGGGGGSGGKGGGGAGGSGGKGRDAGGSGGKGGDKFGKQKECKQS